MGAGRAICRVLLVAALVSAWPRRLLAEEPPLTPAEASPEVVSRTEIDPPSTHPPWTGREAIWGGVGLIIAGVATLIVVTPALCSSSMFKSATPVAGTTPGPDPRLNCEEATIGGGGGGVALGAILLAVGELQRATYKEWLRKHPMFGDVVPVQVPGGAALEVRVEF